MSFLSGSTKKVSVYGRKAEVRVVNRQSTFTSLENVENDPFGFFKPQTKPKATYGKSRASMLPSKLHSKSTGSEDDDSVNELSATDQSQAYDTADSSLSFHSACSSKSASSSSDPQPSETSKKSGQRKALVDKAEPAALPKPKKALAKAIESSTLDATPKARRTLSRKDAVDSPKTVRKLAPVRASAPTLPNESTPPPPTTQPTGRASRRAAQAARMAIEDYDFTDRDMTPRRPVPTKSYFVEKARQLAELAMEEEQERQQAEGVKTKPNTVRKNARKSMAPKPRHTLAAGSTLSSAIAVSDSSLSSANGVSDSSFEDGGTSQSSFSLVIPSSDESASSVRRTANAGSTSKARQNKRVTRRIAASSDDEDENDKEAAQNSDDESEQDPALRLAAQVADLAVSDEEETAQSDDHLNDLLAAVSQTKLEAFSAVIQRLRASSKSTSARRRLEKIGEASYSEVFKISASAAADRDQQEATVLKIIPISRPSSDQDDDLPYTSPAADVEREIRLMQLVARESSASGSFVSLRAAHVVRGAYPAALLSAWDRWDAKRRAKTGEGAENIRPHVLGRQAVYAVLVMSDGGVDLESLRVKSWVQAASIFAQVVGGLGAMEAKYEFEHRDLHWGNILVQAVEPSADAADDAARWLTDPSVSGVKATIIDFTLSRACVKSRGKRAEVLHYPFDDDSLFDGTGDAQFDVYRQMRTVTRGEWQAYCAATNVLWLRYLVHKLVDVKCKTHRVPKLTSHEKEAQSEARAYEWLQRAVVRLDRAVERLVDDGAAVGGRKSMTARARSAQLSGGRARKGRATTAGTPLGGHEDEGKAPTSAAGLMAFLDL
ncbi:conserved hypothetical protein [Sporisorium reilianum SRZ2]|uniref:non-specific serine/threonine protein kinase n=1 Tax=Sporisorium reilianum (strain SRZ2) TaxID=999809 RepID=E6ZLN5_SPORE|nr:conserved hypothetical protein [Sporisorium reilianum SRZ2]